MKSISGILDDQKLPFLQFWRLWGLKCTTKKKKNFRVSEFASRKSWNYLTFPHCLSLRLLWIGEYDFREFKQKSKVRLSLFSRWKIGSSKFCWYSRIFLWHRFEKICRIMIQFFGHDHIRCLAGRGTGHPSLFGRQNSTLVVYNI